MQEYQEGISETERNEKEDSHRKISNLKNIKRENKWILKNSVILLEKITLLKVKALIT